MTYHRDGSPFVITPGLAYPHIVNYGWLSLYVPFATGDATGWEPFKELADTVRVWVTRGQHTCDFCESDVANYGNSEIWLRMGKQTVRFPCLIWHYIKEHRYVLPASIMSAIQEKQYIAYSDDEIDVELRLTGNTCIAVSHVRCVAKWKEERYKNLMTFQNANGGNWHFSSCYIRDGFYVTEPHLIPEMIGIRFEADPGNFPDSIAFTTVVGPTPVAGN